VKNSELSKRAQVWLFVLRLGTGWLFLYAGLTKVLDPLWSAEGFLKGAKTFAGFYSWFLEPDMLWAVNVVNEWALVLLGASLILGLFVRPSGIFGVILMLLYYFASSAIPSVPNGFIVDAHIILALILAFLIAVDAGNFFGLDRFLRNQERAKVENY